MDLQDSVTVHIEAPPEKVWELVSDVTRIGRYSPETFEAEWLDGATGPAVGVRFRGHVKRNEKGPTYWSAATITVCDEPREFAFAVGPPGKGINTWRYVLTPSGAGTDVTESFELKPILPIKIYWALLGRWRGKTNHRGMERTLAAMKAELEGTAA
jgi:uncharacterized protein YndB with AHSA1/START domain